jgi:uncharacterized coiled-coil protein SlyX
MWPFNRTTHEDLSKRIDVLEERIELFRERTAELSSDLNDVEQELEQVEGEVAALIDAVNRVAVDDIPDPQVPKKVGEVHRLNHDCVGYKRTGTEIATLVLPEGTQVVYARDTDWRGVGSTKLRADQAVVARLEHPHHARHRSEGGYDSFHNNTERFRTARDKSGWDPDFTYTVGEVVTPDNGFEATTAAHCAGGIHFYRTLSEAV